MTYDVLKMLQYLKIIELKTLNVFKKQCSSGFFVAPECCVHWRSCNVKLCRQSFKHRG